MVISKGASVDEYLDELSNERREGISKLRSLAKEYLPGFREGMRWGMVNFYRSEAEQVSFASQVQYISLYVGPAVLETRRSELKGVDAAKGCIRFRSTVSIDWGLVIKLMREAARKTTFDRGPNRNRRA
ncbi:MAG: DUF1801 domain-containing protein [Thermoplasmata archaeon]|nr:DUF1801 domain-containing protein [Thermoplasmata archaeon]